MGQAALPVVPGPLRGRQAGLGQTHPVLGLPGPGVSDTQRLPSQSLFPLRRWRAPTPPTALPISGHIGSG